MVALLNTEKFEGEKIVLSLAIRQHLNSLVEETSNNRLFNKYSKLYNFEKNETRSQKQLLQPNRNELEYNCVETWEKSEKNLELEKEFSTIWRECVKTGFVKGDDLVKLGQYARFTLAIFDKNRSSSYNFYNSDYLAKIPVFLPENMSIWTLEDLPKEWQLYSPPETDPQKEPSCHEVRIDGNRAGIKGQEQTTIIINRKCLNLLQKYQDIKRIFLEN